MANPTFQTTLTLNEEDNVLREQLTNRGITLIDTWRRGALELVREIQIQDMEDKENE